LQVAVRAIQEQHTVYDELMVHRDLFAGVERSLGVRQIIVRRENVVLVKARNGSRSSANRRPTQFSDGLSVAPVQSALVGLKTKETAKEDLVRLLELVCRARLCEALDLLPRCGSSLLQLEWETMSGGDR
jgi:hypothetical protein